MTEPIYKHNENVLLHPASKVYTIIRVKHCTFSNGQQDTYYMIQDNLGNVYREAEECWFEEKRLRKCYEASTLTFNELKEMMEEI